jgi:hypothetical protein
MLTSAKRSVVWAADLSFLPPWRKCDDTTRELSCDAENAIASYLLAPTRGRSPPLTCDGRFGSDSETSPNESDWRVAVRRHDASQLSTRRGWAQVGSHRYAYRIASLTTGPCASTNHSRAVNQRSIGNRVVPGRAVPRKARPVICPALLSPA